ncbi:putative hydrolase C777.06c [Silene latifolia]|uniref:putative hydrolase C777.06c n=1 Tax=Silene latifolia TaxID=37657 RepID=UPI003D77C90D
METNTTVRTQPESQSALIFMGTGCSSGVPSLRCLIQPSHPPCRVCSQSLITPPQFNPNYRCNTSLLIDYCQKNGEHSYILIDMGKTFREQVLRWFTLYKIPRLDSVLLTHEHADAVHGLDDIHSVNQFGVTNSISPLPIYATQECVDSVLSRFPHLSMEADKKGRVQRQESPPVDWRIIEGQYENPFVASGLQFNPLPVMHGEDYVSLGYLFGDKCKVAYVSDVSRFPSSTESVISESGGGQLDLLILDTNTIHLIEGPSTHLCFPKALDAVKKIRPKSALLIGMNHAYDHDRINASLMDWSQREGVPVQLAYDGLRIPIEL